MGTPVAIANGLDPVVNDLLRFAEGVVCHIAMIC